MKYFLLVVAVLLVWCSHGDCNIVDELTSDESAIETALTDGVADGMSAVATYLGFNCPAGYRCLPVLECLPCDYGTYKSDTSSKLCTACPTGCTTLRKGASTWRECVPMCPPGYETSECGKTCVKCQPGFYKSTWLNEACDMCPLDSNPDSVTLAMTNVTQCYTDETDDDPTDSTSEPEDPTCPAECTLEEYSIQLHIPLVGSMCGSFCHCETATQNGTYKYTEKQCAAGAMWVIGDQTCLHEDVYERSCVAEGLVSDGLAGSGDQTSECKAICEDEFTNETIYQVLNNTGCGKFCVCGWYLNNTVYWQEIACTSGYMVDVNSDYQCVESGVYCPDVDDPTDSTSELEDPTCPAECTLEEYSIQLHIPLVGSMCGSFCHCETATQNGTYKYTEKQCAAGAMWVIGDQTCLHEDVYERSCVAEGLVSDELAGSGDQTSECKAICEDEFTNETIYRVLNNTGCGKFCVCGWYLNNTVYWQEIACTSGYMVDVNSEYRCVESGVYCPDDSSTGSDYSSDYSYDYSDSYDYSSSYDSSSSYDYNSYDSSSSYDYNSYDSSSSYDYNSYDSSSSYDYNSYDSSSSTSDYGTGDYGSSSDYYQYYG